VVRGTSIFCRFAFSRQVLLSARNLAALRKGYKRRHFCTIARYDDTVSVQIFMLTLSADGRNLPMKAKSQDERIRCRLKPLKRWCLLPALVSVIASPATSIAQGTPEARQACTPDAFRLCSGHIPDADEVAACLRERNAELSDACRKFVAAGMKSSDKSDSIDARKRLAR
jgi:hypothetical protein